MAEYKYLNKINSPADLKLLQEDEIIPLSAEIRDFLIDKVTQNGGHLASNLGVVELTLAIHRVFDIPKDHLIFDVSHQSYVHKIITGRKERFDTLRQGGGLSGFMKVCGMLKKKYPQYRVNLCQPRPYTPKEPFTDADIDEHEVLKTL